MCKYALMICALMAAGCTQQTSAPLRVMMQDSALYVGADQGIGTGDLMEVAEDVLAGMYFTIEKADVDSGLIRTRPLPGAQFFEFWRSDNVGTDNTLAANLHTIRRTVTLDISHKIEDRRQKTEDRKERAQVEDLLWRDGNLTSDICSLTSVLRIGCEVQAQRLSLPERQVSSSARAYGMFSRSSPSLQRLKLNPEQKKEMAWIDLGRDSRLEAEILKRIETRIIQRTSHKLQMAEKQT